MLARALGARVFNYEDKRSEIGYYPIEPTPAADRLCPARFPRSVYQWHSDGFDLPEGAELLAAGGADFPNQAYRYGRHAVGLQFHPEVTYHMMCRWTHRARRAPDPARRAEPPRAPRRLVPARRPGGRLARGVSAGLARGAAHGGLRRGGAPRAPASSARLSARSRRFDTPRLEPRTGALGIPWNSFGFALDSLRRFEPFQGVMATPSRNYSWVPFPAGALVIALINSVMSIRFYQPIAVAAI